MNRQIKLEDVPESEFIIFFGTTICLRHKKIMSYILKINVLTKLLIITYLKLVALDSHGSVHKKHTYKVTNQRAKN